MGVREKIGFYWRQTGHELSWEIAYRRRKDVTSTLLNDTLTEFEIVPMPKGFWGADPLSVEVNGDLYLFFEMFREKDGKGLIACATYENRKFSEPKIVLEEECHLSFPFIFKSGDVFYMIPETGGRKTLELFKCVEFPYKWEKVKIIAEALNSSDTIVFRNDGKLYLLASILVSNNACEAQNTLYKLDETTFVLEKIAYCPSIGCHGVRNAGPLFSCGKKTYRPGQNCDGKSYGKSLLIFEIDIINGDTYIEHEIADITIDDIVIKNMPGKFHGIHTYTVTENYEFIDLKKIVKHSLTKRIGLMVKYAKNIMSDKLN